MAAEEPVLFALNPTCAFGEAMARALSVSLCPHEEREFEDGEHKIRPLCSVRGRDVFVVHALYGDERATVNDKLCRLLFFVGALRDAAAASITAVIPYLCYARKDRKTKSRDPLTTRYVAQLLEAVGTDGVVTLEVHNLAAFQNAFRIRTEHLEATRLFVDYCEAEFRDEPPVVMSPDVGGIKRANAFKDALSRRLGRPLTAAFIEKQRSGGIVSGEQLVGDVAGKPVVIIDDLISSGTTLARAAAACREHGSRRIQALATHGLFVRDAERILSQSSIERIVVSNSVPAFRLSESFANSTLTILDVAPLLAAAIRAIHEGSSIVELMEI